MNRTSFWLGSLVVLLAATSTAFADEFRDLFDGKSLEGWVVEGPAKDKSGQTMWSVARRANRLPGGGFWVPQV